MPHNNKNIAQLWNSELIIFSTALVGLDEKEQVRRDQLAARMLTECRIEFIHSVGAYKGVKENSFIVFSKNDGDSEYAKALAFEHFNQESVLYQDSNGSGYLIYAPHNKVEYIGDHVAITRKQAKKAEAYTQVPRYFFSYQF